jgi:FkbM family methyltransferase
VAIHPSQRQEEQAVRDFLDGRTTGFFVEVGANHATERSQTWHLEQLGWTGILIEPQPDLAAALVAVRAAQVFAVACSSPENAGQSLPLHVDGIDGALSALNRDRMAPGAQPKRVILVPVRTLDSVLQEAETPVPIDLLSVDVEGHEVEVFLGFDFQRWRPTLLLVEDHVNSLRTHRLLTAKGYRLIRRLGNNGWYVPAAAPVRVSVADRWEIVRKYYLALPFRRLRNMWRDVRRQYADRRARR